MGQAILSLIINGFIRSKKSAARGMSAALEQGRILSEALSRPLNVAKKSVVSKSRVGLRIGRSGYDRIVKVKRNLVSHFEERIR